MIRNVLASYSSRLTPSCSHLLFFEDIAFGPKNLGLKAGALNDR